VRFLHGTAIRGTAAAQDKVKIGFITTLSGPAGIIGKHMKDSVELALDHLGRKVGGVCLSTSLETRELGAKLGPANAGCAVLLEKREARGGPARLRTP